ncbi:MAG: hypothetical protein GKR99_04460 [Rhodobacteraceae bacterium]|nr:hypothetical protein [Paracoccaceae bacterium]
MPLLVSAPGKYAPRRVKDCVSLVDLLPTLVGIAGGEVTLPCDGESLDPALTGVGTRDLAISDYYGIGPCVPYRMVRQGRFKLIFTHGHPDQLFDLEDDPDELRNLADDPAHAGTLSGLRAILLDGWDPAAIDQKIRTSQAERLFLKATRRGMCAGEPAAWTAPRPTADCQGLIRLRRISQICRRTMWPRSLMAGCPCPPICKQESTMSTAPDHPNHGTFCKTERRPDA